MLYEKLTETTRIFSLVQVFLGNILLFEFSLSKSEGIDYVSKVSDKGPKMLLIYI